MTAVVLFLLAGFQFDLPGEKHVTLTIAAEPVDPFDVGNSPSGKLTVRRGETFFVVLKGTPQAGWYTYPATKHAKEQPDGQLAKFTIKGDYVVPLWPLRETEPEWKDTGIGWHLQHKKPFIWTQEVFVKPDAPAGKVLTLTYELDLQVCKDSCIQEHQSLTLEVTVRPDPPRSPEVDISGRPTKAPAPEVVTHPSEMKTTQPSNPANVPPTVPSGDSSWWLFQTPLVRAILSGFVSLLTPCVFPMIPITVSYFIKQGEAKKGSPVLMALVYSGTITLVLVAGGLALMQVLTAVINHPLTNFVLAFLFGFFALSLLGWYDITLPSWLQDATASGENQGGLMGVFFMALTFSIISFACVGPVYGSFLSLEAAGQSSYVTKVAAVVAFSAAFASPFFLLALFPTMLRQMPRAGSWMNSVKVVMGFMELAAAVKFLRSGELGWLGAGDIFSYPLCMALYVALCVACGLYLLGVYRLPHDHETPESISVPRLLFALTFLGLGLYLTPGLFTLDAEEVPRKGALFAAVDSFLLDEPGAKSSAKKNSLEDQPWLSSLDEALSRARAENKLVFLDFTGVLCTNCKLNERKIFTRPDVKAAFAKHVLLKLYADTLPAGLKQSPDVPGAKRLRTEIFQSESLPLYALLRPKEEGFDVVGKYGMIKGIIDTGDVPEFLAFLDSK